LVCATQSGPPALAQKKNRIAHRILIAALAGIDGEGKRRRRAACEEDAAWRAAPPSPLRQAVREIIAIFLLTFGANNLIYESHCDFPIAKF
jgi:hypothetical protein